MKNYRKMKKGFTIIEVSLVLAIAGLIFMMVFVALPALQRQARNTSREEDLNNLVTAIKKYEDNNRGALPGAMSESGPIKYVEGSSADANTWSGFLRDYLDSGFEDPSSGESYELVLVDCKTNTDQPCDGLENPTTKNFEENAYKIYVVKPARCAGSDSKGALKSSNPRKLAILYKLEGGGLFCANT